MCCWPRADRGLPAGRRGAWPLLRGRTAAPSTAKALRTGADHGAALLIPLQMLVGDLHGLNTLEHQPAKIAAMEGIWQTQRGAPLLLFACRTRPRAATASRSASPSWPPDPDARPDGEIRGLTSTSGQHPPVAPVFWASG
jgi:cytochrome d ubiquinol oxidase subunit I